MALYDGYRLSNSTAIPQYVGSALPELANMYDTAQKYYTAASTLDQELTDQVLQTPVLDQDKETWSAINSSVQKEFQERVNQGNYEDLYGVVSQRARQIAPKLKVLSDQVRAQQAYKESLENKELNLDLSTKQGLLAMSNNNYKGVRLDQNGRAINAFQGIAPAKNIDTNERTRQALSIMHETSAENIVKTDNGWSVYNSKTGWKKIDPRDVERVWNYARANDPEWRAMDQQQLMIKSFQSLRGLTDESAQAAINAQPELISVSTTDKKGKTVIQQQPNPTKKQLQSLISQGLSPAEAYTRYKNATLEQEQYRNQLGYALGKAYTENSTMVETGVGQLTVEKFKEDLKNKPTEGITVPDAAQSVNPNETLEDVNNKIQQVNTAINGAKELAGQWIQLQPDGQPVMKNGKYVPLAGKDLSQLPPSVNNAINVLDSKVAERKDLEYRQQSTMDEAAYAAGYKGPNGGKVGAYKAIEAKATKDVLGSIALDSKQTYTGQFGTNNVEVSKRDIINAFQKGEAKPIYQGGKLVGIGIMEKGSQRPTIVNLLPGGGNDDAKVSGTVRNNAEVMSRVMETATTNYQSYAKNYASVNPSVRMDLNKPALKEFNDNVISVVAANRAGLEWVDSQSGKELNKEDIAKLNLKDGQTGTVTKVGNKVVQTITIPGKDGEPDKTYRAAFPATSNIAKRYYDIAKKSRDIGVQEAAWMMNPESQSQEIQQLQPNGRVKIRGAENLFVERSNDGVNPVFSVGIENADGTIKYMQDESGTKFYTTSPIQAEIRAIKNLKKRND